MPVQAWVLGVLGAAAWVLGGYAAIKYVLPLLRTVISEIVKNNKATQAFMVLLTYFVVLSAAAGVIDKLIAVGDPNLNYITVVLPALDLLKSLVPYIQWIIIGLAAVIVAERLKLR